MTTTAGTTCPYCGDGPLRINQDRQTLDGPEYVCEGCGARVDTPGSDERLMTDGGVDVDGINNYDDAESLVKPVVENDGYAALRATNGEEATLEDGTSVWIWTDDRDKTYVNVCLDHQFIVGRIDDLSHAQMVRDAIFGDDREVMTDGGVDVPEQSVELVDDIDAQDGTKEIHTTAAKDLMRDQSAITTLQTTDGDDEPWMVIQVAPVGDGCLITTSCLSNGKDSAWTADPSALAEIESAIGAKVFEVKQDPSLLFDDVVQSESDGRLMTGAGVDVNSDGPDVNAERYQHWVENLSGWNDLDELSWVRGTAADRGDEAMFRAADDRMKQVRDSE